MKRNHTTLAALMVCALTTVQSQADLTWQGGSGYWYSANWTDGGTPYQGWSGSVAYIGNSGASASPITLNGWVGADIHTSNGGYLDTGGNGLTGSIYVEDSTRFAIVGNNPHSGGLTLAKGDLQLGYGGDYTPVGGDMVVNAGNLELAAQAASGKTIDGNLYVNSGNVNYQFNNQIGDTATIYARGGTINLGAKSDTVGGLELASGSVISNGTLTSASTYDVRKGSISAELAGSVGLTKSTADTVTLSGTNTYTGATEVNAGKLVINGNNSGATGAVTIASGATLGGSGTVGGATTISGTHAPGNSAGVQSFSGNLSYASTSIFDWELASSSSGARGTQYDGVNAAGTLVGAAGAAFNVVLNSGAFTDTFWNTNQTWSDIFKGNVDGSGSALNIASVFSTITGTGIVWDSSNIRGDVASEGYFTLSGTSLNWTAVPEPTSALAGLLITAGLLRRRRV